MDTPYYPQIATLVSAPPSGDNWLHEIKFDGYRIGCRILDGRLGQRVDKDHAGLIEALLHGSSLARTMPTDRILTGRCDMTLAGRARSSD